MLSDIDWPNNPENKKKDSDKLACSYSKQKKEEIYLRLH